MARRDSPQTNLRLSLEAQRALDELVRRSKVSTSKTREVELALLERLERVDRRKAS